MPDEVTLNRLAQRFYETASGLRIRMTDKPLVVEGLRAVFQALAETPRTSDSAYIPGIDVQGLCPGCGRRALFLGAGGYVTCRIRECPRPTAAADLLDHYLDLGYMDAFGSDGEGERVAWATASVAWVGGSVPNDR